MVTFVSVVHQVAPAAAAASPALSRVGGREAKEECWWELGCPSPTGPAAFVSDWLTVDVDAADASGLTLSLRATPGGSGMGAGDMAATSVVLPAATLRFVLHQPLFGVLYVCGSSVGSLGFFFASDAVASEVDRAIGALLATHRVASPGACCAV
jgi:hypothetical protein